MQITIEQAFPFALQLQRAGRFGEAGELLLKAYRVAPEPIFLFEAAGIHASDGSMEQAATLLETIRSQHPGFAPAERFSRVVRHVLDRGEPAWIEQGESKLGFEVTGQNWEIESVWLEGGVYEPTEVATIIERIPSSSTFIDVGANAGNHTIAVAKARPDVTVVPVEPEPRAARTLRRNIELNELMNVDTRCLGFAVSSRPGPLHLQFRSSSSSTRRSPDASGIEVPTVQLKELLDDRVGFLKIDIEGMEIEILQTAIAELRSFEVATMIEVLESQREVTQEFLLRNELEVALRISMHAGENIVVVPRSAPRGN